MRPHARKATDRSVIKNLALKSSAKRSLATNLQAAEVSAIKNSVIKNSAAATTAPHVPMVTGPRVTGPTATVKTVPHAHSGIVRVHPVMVTTAPRAGISATAHRVVILETGHPVPMETGPTATVKTAPHVHSGIVRVPPVMVMTAPRAGISATAHRVVILVIVRPAGISATGHPALMAIGPNAVNVRSARKAPGSARATRTRAVRPCLIVVTARNALATSHGLVTSRASATGHAVTDHNQGAANAISSRVTARVMKHRHHARGSVTVSPKLWLVPVFARAAKLKNGSKPVA